MNLVEKIHRQMQRELLNEQIFVITVAFTCALFFALYQPYFNSIPTRLGVGVLLGEWLRRIANWALQVRSMRAMRIENIRLHRMILNATSLTALHLDFAAFLAQDRRPE